MNTDYSTARLETLANLLSEALLGRPCTVEYPGFIACAYAGGDHPERGTWTWAIGTANGPWAGDVTDEDGNVHKGFQIPGSDTWGLDLVAERLASSILTSENYWRIA